MGGDTESECLIEKYILEILFIVVEKEGRGSPVTTTL